MPDAMRQWYKFTAAKAAAKNGDAEDAKTATLHIYDVIGADPFFGGVDVNEAIALIEGLDEDAELTVRINSPGGAAWDGLALANAIMRHPGPTTTHVDALAASAASLVALAGDTVTMSKYGQMMLHNARAGVHGTAEDLKSAAETLAKLNGSMAQFYADRTGSEPADWAKAMKRESWYTADEALEAGLVTSVDESGARDQVEAAAAASIAKVAAQFKYAGRQAAPAPTAQITENGPTGPDTKEANVAISKQVADRLGLGEDATDEQVLAKIEELGKTETDDAGTGGGAAGGDAPEAGKVSEVMKAAAELGLTVIDTASVTEMRANSELGAKAHATMEAQRITALVEAAFDAGKILPASKAQYIKMMAADETGTTALLASIPAHSVVPMNELGHATQPIAQTGDVGDITEDPKYAGWKF
ncbi:head maturation protease, ClpP-related [Mycolicibacterium llatzerense]|uniref:head maturation protease, ClpP-related n=1 Tax=Mycolicibacterium llatzerense TaxID=280871 RepID=UPI0021B51A93|nr:head maturation protease, ClpP-related [Mycolicibacterium llatzerense]